MPARIDILFNKFIDGSCTAGEYEELMELLRNNQHEERVRQLLQQIYQSTAGSLRSATYVDDKGHLQKVTEEVPRPFTAEEEVSMPRIGHRRRWMAAAAILVLLSAGAWWLLTQRSSIPSHPSLATGSKARKSATQKGELRYVLLPDSTQVWLNVASTLEFPATFHKDSREVYLVGEAFFDVKHAQEHPFLIHTGKVVTKVLGTAFNIKAYPGQSDIVVSVKRGKVEVRKNDQLVATLVKGQEVKVMAIEKPAELGQLKDSRVGEWTAGNLSYTSRTLQDILQDLERNYNVVIELTDSHLAQEVFTTAFRRDVGIEEALEILCGVTGTKLSKQEGKYLISR